MTKERHNSLHNTLLFECSLEERWKWGRKKPSGRVAVSEREAGTSTRRYFM